MASTIQIVPERAWAGSGDIWVSQGKAVTWVRLGGPPPISKMDKAGYFKFGV